MGGLLLACARWYPRPSWASEPGLPWTRAEVVIFSAILGLALLTHLAWLDTLPWRFHYDELIAYNEAMRFYRGPAISLFTTTWWNTGLPLASYFSAPKIAWLLEHVEGARDQSNAGEALFGTLDSWLL